MAKALTERQKHGAKVLARMRASHRAACRNPGRRERRSPINQWCAYGLAMARKAGLIPADLDVKPVLDGRTVHFYSIDPQRRRWIPEEHVAEYTIPDRVWFYNPASDAILAEAWQPEPADLDLEECLA